VTHRAYCKDLVVNLSVSDQYPEFPANLDLSADKAKTTTSNVWRKWRSDTLEDKLRAFNNDIASPDSFDAPSYIKDADELDNCKHILLDNFDYIKIVFIEMLVRSPRTFPEISSEAFF